MYLFRHNTLSHMWERPWLRAGEKNTVEWESTRKKTETETKDETEIEKLQKTKNWNKETVEREEKGEKEVNVTGYGRQA